MTEEKRAEVVAALERFIEETTVLSADGHLMRWADGMPVAVSITHAVEALAYLRGEPHGPMRGALDLALKDALADRRETL